MAKKFPIHPEHPERLCWGCDKYCAADALLCGNGSERTQHPVELFGEDWKTWGHDYVAEPVRSAAPGRPQASSHRSAQHEGTPVNADQPS